MCKTISARKLEVVQQFTKPRILVFPVAGILIRQGARYVYTKK